MAGKPKILIWDIESTALNSTFGTVLCIGWKFLDEDEVYIPTILDAKSSHLKDDSILVDQFVEAFDKADIHVTWYGERFDLPMINSKLIKYGRNPLPNKPHLDLWKTARKHFKLHSNRLAVWGEYLGCENQKTPITHDDWLHAALGDEGAMEQVVDHCFYDVLVLEEVFDKMRPWIKEEPAHQLFTGGEPMSCPSCGSTHLQKRGFHVARTRKYQRWACQECGKWSRSRTAEKIATELVGGW